jgi:hypothetical protein
MPAEVRLNPEALATSKKISLFFCSQPDLRIDNENLIAWNAK